MAAAGAGREGGLPPSMDRISALPDELLHAILSCLPSTAAARTSVVSHRWRRVWTSVPALSFQVERKRSKGGTFSSKPAAVDAALAAYSAAATLSHLEIDVLDGTPPVASAAHWLRFASRRLAGELHLTHTGRDCSVGCSAAKGCLDLPACERATRIELCRLHHLLRLPSAGEFAALRVLRIDVATVADSDVGRLVSTQCPRLRELELCDVGSLAFAADFKSRDDAGLSIRSASIERLVLRRVHVGKDGRIEIAAPRLYYLTLVSCVYQTAATIAAPMLTELTWDHGYDPSRHSLQADRHIYRLDVRSSNAALFRQFDAVEELCINLFQATGEGYKKMLKYMDEVLPKARILEVKGLSANQHLGPTMLHLLRNNSCRPTKIKIDLFPVYTAANCGHGCSCVPPESWRTNDVVLDSLEELEISSFTGAAEDMEFLKLLFRCKLLIRRMAVHARPGFPLSRETQKRIWAIARPYCLGLEFETTQYRR